VRQTGRSPKKPRRADCAEENRKARAALDLAISTIPDPVTVIEQWLKIARAGKATRRKWSERRDVSTPCLARRFNDALKTEDCRANTDRDNQRRYRFAPEVGDDGDRQASQLVIDAIPKPFWGGGV